MRLIVLLAVAAIQLGAPTDAATAKIPKLYSNCTQLNKRHPHGLGRYGAQDKTAGTPVTNFFHSTRLYNLAIHYNRRLDRDDQFGTAAT